MGGGAGVGAWWVGLGALVLVGAWLVGCIGWLLSVVCKMDYGGILGQFFFLLIHVECNQRLAMVVHVGTRAVFECRHRGVHGALANVH